MTSKNRFRGNAPHYSLIAHKNGAKKMNLLHTSLALGASLRNRRLDAKICSPGLKLSRASTNLWVQFKYLSGQSKTQRGLWTSDWWQAKHLGQRNKLEGGTIVFAAIGFGLTVGAGFAGVSPFFGFKKRILSACPSKWSHFAPHFATMSISCPFCDRTNFGVLTVQNSLLPK